MWATDWANDMGKDGWEFITFEFETNPLQILDNRPAAPGRGMRTETEVWASGFAKRRFAGSPHR